VLIKKNPKAWEDCIPHTEFAYNQARNSVTLKSPFEFVHGFEPPTVPDLLSLPLQEQVSKNAAYMRKLHEETCATIEKKVLRQAERINKNKKT
jgi:hypothetical protein